MDVPREAVGGLERAATMAASGSQIRAGELDRNTGINKRTPIDGNAQPSPDIAIIYPFNVN
ncbi:MAG: hypothetical protein A3J97_15345 [Spirochaetes bacterium RIFOXYC1_FULL_54_7]|nr:MAG: hypothetical protein A3J97_15345 [Spirochaetes bacterium RIFOXYC1_FULL_54_7]